MARGPQDGPLGSKPVLPEPAGKTAAKASTLFGRFLAQARQMEDEPTQPMAPESTPVAPGPTALPHPDSFGHGRRYDLALSKVANVVEHYEHGDYHDGDPDNDDYAGDAYEELPDPAPTALGFAPPAQLDIENDPVAQAIIADREAKAAARERGDDPELPTRPPPGAAAVRPSAPAPRGPEAVPQSLLEDAADSAMLINDGDTTSFDIAFKDDVFEDLGCRISITDGRVVAVFKVRDDNLRRLLEAESGRLRVSLEDRGLRVEEVRVEVER